jgi:hypothetical protein
MSTNKRTWISDEDFIRLWEFSESMEEVAEAAGLRIESVRRRARNMRMHGVPLTILPKYKNPVQGKSFVKDAKYWANLAKKREELLKEASKEELSSKQLRLLRLENRSDS